MRLLLTTIILTMLAQPVWAYSVEDLVKYCTFWSNTGYSGTFSYDKAGTNALACSSYMSAVSDFGEQNCVWKPESYLKWNATPAQLAQFLLNRAQTYPEAWNLFGYTFLVSEDLSAIFPCN